MKKISIIIVLLSFSFSGFSQEEEKAGSNGITWSGHTALIGSYYHLGSYSKERPLSGIEQTIEAVIHPKYSVGLGFGANLYPADLVVPIFATGRFIHPINQKFDFFIVQSYGRNLKMGDIGFNSNRNYGGFGVFMNLFDKFSLSADMGYLMNWDKFGGKSLSFTGSFGLYYQFN